MGKNKKKEKYPEPEGAYVPAWSLFCDLTMTGHEYEWGGWGMVIKHLREYTGMDQTAFGRLLRGYTRSQISRYEKEDANPPIDFFIKLMRTFGVDLNWLFTGVGKPYTLDFQDSEERARFLHWTYLMDERMEFLNDISGDTKNYK